jgi:hypothetical protein
MKTVVLDGLTVAKLVKKCPTLHGDRRFIAVFTKARHRFLPEPDESSPHFYTLFI